MIYLAHAAVIPPGNVGSYTYEIIDEQRLVEIIEGQHGPWESRMGFRLNADFVQSLTGYPVPLVYRNISLDVGDSLCVVRPDAQGVKIRDIHDCTWEVGLLTRIS